MELRQLRYFVAVAEEGNISRAAKRIFLTQPALSRQIKALEKSIGQCLLERQAHSIRLTPVGAALLPEARLLIQRADELVARLRATGDGLRLRVGYSPSLAAGLLPAAVANFRQVHANSRVELFDQSTGEMLTGLESGTLDVALTVGQESRTRGLHWTPLVRAPWLLAVHRDHPLAKRSRIGPADVAAETLLLFRQNDYPEYWEAVTGWLRENRQRPKLGGEFDGVDSLMAAVESRQGIALVATRKGRLIPETVRLKALSPAPAPLCIAAGYRQDRAGEKPLAVFVEELHNQAQTFK